MFSRGPHFAEEVTSTLSIIVLQPELAKESNSRKKKMITNES